MSNFYKYEQSGKKAAKVIAAVLIALIVVAGVVGVTVNAIRNNSLSEQENNYSAGSFVIDSYSDGATLMVSAFKANTLVGGNETVNTGSTAQVSLTYTPSYLTNVKFDYALAFENPSSAWASGKNVGDYMAFTPSSDGATTGTLNCKMAFGEPIILTATARDNSGMSASCTLGYIARPQSLDVVFCATDFGDNCELEFSYDMGDGTHEGEFYGEAYMNINQSFADEVKSRLDFDVTFKSYHISNIQTGNFEGYFYIQSADGGSFTWDMFIEQFDSLTQEQKNQLYYTWRQVWLVADNKYNVLLDYNINYAYGGQNIYSHSESDLLSGWLTGDADGSEITITDVSINPDGMILF